MCINHVDVSFRAMINHDNTDGNAITSFGCYMSNNGISPMMVNAKQNEYLNSLPSSAVLVYLACTHVDGTNNLANGIMRHVMSYLL